MFKMKILFLAFLPLIAGCALGAASAAYSIKAGSADDIASSKRKEIVDEASDKAFEKCKTYMDENFVKKDKCCGFPLRYK